MHPLIPWQPAAQPDLAGRRILITAGERDPISPPPATEALESYLRDQDTSVQTHWHRGGHGIDQSELAAIETFFARSEIATAAA